MAKNVINSLVFPFFEDDARESAAHAPTDSKMANIRELKRFSPKAHSQNYVST